MLLRYGETRLLAVVLALLVNLLKRVGVRLVEVVARPERVDGEINGVSHCRGVGLAHSGDVVTWRQVGRRADDRQSGKIVHVAVRTQGLHRRETLVPIHRHHGVEGHEATVAKELLALVWSEDANAGVRQLLYGRYHHLLFLFPGVRVGVVGVECQHRYAWVLYREVAAQRGVELCHGVDYSFLADGRGHVAQGNVAGQRRQPHVLAHEHVESLLLACEANLDEALVAREVVAVDVHVVFFHGCHHEHVEEPVLEVGYGAVYAFYGGAARVLRWHAEVHLHLVVVGGEQVEPAILGFRGVGDDAERVAVEAEGVAMVRRHLGRAIDYWRAQVEHGRCLERLEDKLISNAVCVTVGQCHAYFSLVHISL